MASDEKRTYRDTNSSICNTLVELQILQRPLDKSATQRHYYWTVLTTVLTPLQCKNLYLSFPARSLKVLDTFYTVFVLKSTVLSSHYCKEVEFVPAVSQNLETLLKDTLITPESVTSAQKPSKHKTLFKIANRFCALRCN